MPYTIHPMHIPDGFLSVPVSLILWAVSIAVIGTALRRVSSSLQERQVPLMGVLAAAIFAGQMLNFSVTGGTSGHLLGAALAAILLGPWSAVLVMTSVVAVQALIFQDGGLIVLGANLFNMAVVGVFVAYAVNTLMKRLFMKSSADIFISGFMAAWGSIFIASLACALELAASGLSPANIAVPAMGLIHALIGVGEGLITLGALTFLHATRRDLLTENNPSNAGSRGIVIGGLAIAILLAVLSPLASSHPDGLEWVAEQNGFLSAARDTFYNLMPDYALGGVASPAIATVAAGIIGVAIVLTVALGIGRVSRRGSPSEHKQG